MASSRRVSLYLPKKAIDTIEKFQQEHKFNTFSKALQRIVILFPFLEQENIVLKEAQIKATSKVETAQEPVQELDCLLRANIRDDLYCGRLAPNFKKIKDIALCGVCSHRITKAGMVFQKATGKTASPLIERAKLIKNDPDKRWCPRDKQWFFYGRKNCLRCTWKPTECKVKREALKRV